MRPQVELRPATLDDADILFTWRNDADTRRMAGVATRIRWPEYVDWLKASLSDPRREILIAAVEGRPVGTIRCDRWDETQEIAWTVAPEWRGRGIGKRMVAEFCRRWRGRLRARIKAHNTASKRIAAYAGMRRVARRDGIDHFERPAWNHAAAAIDRRAALSFL